MAGAGFLALAVVPVLALNSLAGADPGARSAAEGAPAGHPAPPGLTDTQRECLAAHGVTPPTPPAAGTKPTPPPVPPVSPEARRAAEAACGLPAGPPMPRGPRGPGGRPGPGLI